jgi:7-carboxy-7-deazaguanine synthase
MHVETNGTIAPTRELVRACDLFVVSPKLAHAGRPERDTIKPAVLAQFAQLRALHKVAFKFVCRTAEDVGTVAQIAAELHLSPWDVWVMAEGVDAATLAQRDPVLVGPALAAGFNYTTRLHVLLWGTERGR